MFFLDIYLENVFFLETTCTLFQLSRFLLYDSALLEFEFYSLYFLILRS